VTELQVEGVDGHLVADGQHGHRGQVAGWVGDVGAGGQPQVGACRTTPCTTTVRVVACVHNTLLAWRSAQAAITGYSLPHW